MFLKKGGISRRGDGKRKEGLILLSALCSRFSVKSVIKHCLESAKQNITKTELIMNASNIPYYFEQLLLLTYICTYSIISNTKSTIVTPNILICKIKPFVLIISSQGNFQFKYLRIKFYCFFIASWRLLPEVIPVLQWGWPQIIQQDMNSHSVSHFIF